MDQFIFILWSSLNSICPFRIFSSLSECVILILIVMLRSRNTDCQILIVIVKSVAQWERSHYLSTVFETHIWLSFFRLMIVLMVMLLLLMSARQLAKLSVSVQPMLQARPCCEIDAAKLAAQWKMEHRDQNLYEKKQNILKRPAPLCANQQSFFFFFLRFVN